MVKTSQDIESNRKMGEKKAVWNSSEGGMERASDEREARKTPRKKEKSREAVRKRR